MMSKKSGHVPATFNDIGTGETFEGGKEHSFEAGAHANYLAAGLIEVPAAKPKPAAKRAARPAKRSARPTPSVAPVPPAPSGQATNPA
jgi:hypothetical protein